MSDEALNEFLSLPLCPTCDGYGEQPDEIFYGNAVTLATLPCSRCIGLGRVLPHSRAEADMLAVLIYADAIYEEVPA